LIFVVRGFLEIVLVEQHYYDETGSHYEFKRPS
jgi:hypothetical protein